METKQAKYSYEMHYGGYTYIVSEDLLKQGDYYFDFVIHRYRGNPIHHCDSEALANIINKNYDNKPFIERRSAKIAETNDPTLIEHGVKKL